MRLYAVAVVAVVVFSVLQVAAVPLAVTYDGHIYLNMADVLFSSRFPHDWVSFRTPLYPAAESGLLGLREASGGGSPGQRALGTGRRAGLGVVREAAGPRAGTLAMALTAPFPLLVAYEHFALTEVGTFALGWPGQRADLDAWRDWHRWVKALGLALLLTAGYYYRQNTLAAAPLAALLYLFGVWKMGHVGALDNNERTGRRKLAAARGTVLVQSVLVGVLPFVLAKPWDRYIDNVGLRGATLKQGILRQALLPPNHPCLGEHARAYAEAIEQSQTGGNFLCGIPCHLVNELSVKICPALGNRPRTDLRQARVGKPLAVSGRSGTHAAELCRIPRSRKRERDLDEPNH